MDFNDTIPMISHEPPPTYTKLYDEVARRQHEAAEVTKVIGIQHSVEDLVRSDFWSDLRVELATCEHAKDPDGAAIATIALTAAMKMTIAERERELIERQSSDLGSTEREARMEYKTQVLEATRTNASTAISLLRGWGGHFW